ncbi:hypothetical protein ANTQUA_LOCUS10573 [Anthophora quadrimaculata]
MGFRHVLYIGALENQHSNTVAYSTWDYSPNNTTQVFSVLKILGIELRQYYHYRTVVVARFASDTSFRLEAFANQDSTTVAYITWYCSRNTSIQVFSIVIVPRMELRLFYLSRSQVEVFSIVMVLRTVLRLFCLSRTVIEARCASDTCFRLEAFENRNSPTVAYSTWDYGPNHTTQVFSVVKILRIDLRQYYHYRTVVAARFASDTSFRLEAFENQHSSIVAYSTWDYGPNNTTQVFSVVKILRIELRQYYHYRTVVVARFASGTSVRLEAFEYQNSTTVAYSTW